MAEFLTPTDIGNRAAQHCGAELMDDALGFTEVSKTARQISFVYGKLRQAELRRRNWKFAMCRTVLRARDTNTMLLTPSVWVSTVSYFAGSIVSDAAGTSWISRNQNNLGNQPQVSNAWDPYFGPMSVSLYDSTLAYFSGELVYTAAGDGTSLIYQSLIDGNSDVPGTATAYSSTTTYFTNQVVTYLSVAYMSLIDLNLAQTPTASPLAWSSATTYSAAQTVCGSDGIIYTSIAGGNVNHDPTNTGGVYWTAGALCPWTRTFTGGTGSINWLLIGGTGLPSGVGLTTINTRYPVGCGPSSQSMSKNIFRLPAGFLHLPSQNPKPGIGVYGGPTGVSYNDWLIERQFLITSDGGPIPLRFVADMQDVSLMDPMFCEGLAARIGLEVCEPLTQSSAKLQTIKKIYDQWIMEAGVVNAIESGYEDPPDDELITVRL